MTLRIEIFLPDDQVGANHLAQHMSTLGYYPPDLARYVRTDEDFRASMLTASESAQSEDVQTPHAGSIPLPTAAEPQPGNLAATPTRERGKPAPGRARRTKEEMAEDEAADRADAERQQAAEKAGIQTASADDVKPAISTGGERIGPEDAATAEQDAADEKAEADANAAARIAKEPEKVLTHDDVRNALGGYVKKFGMAAAQEDGPKVIGIVCGEGKVKVSDIPDDQAVLAKVVAGIGEMLEKNPFSREAV